MIVISPSPVPRSLDFMAALRYIYCLLFLLLT